MLLERLTWQEAKQRLTPATAILVPTGATEQHGPGATFAVDYARAEGAAALIAERLEPEGVVLPGIRYAVSPHHLPFPGTVSIDEETFMALVTDIVHAMAHHGARRILFVNGHGGNTPALRLALGQLAFERPELALAAVDISGAAADVEPENGPESRFRGHATQRELSQSLYLAPWTTRPAGMAEATMGERVDELTHPVIKVARLWSDLTVDGATGNGGMATEAFGRAQIDTAVQRIAAWVQGWA